MRVGTYIPSRGMPYSLRIYVNNLLPELTSAGCGVSVFGYPDKIPDGIDILWTPCTGWTSPPAGFQKSGVPVVASFHGTVFMSLPTAECYGYSPIRRMMGALQKYRTIRQWKLWDNKRIWVVGVSEYASKEFINGLGVRVLGTSFAYHGVDHSIFRPASSSTDGRYFIHVSAYQPKKNVHRIIRAFKSMHNIVKSDMRLVIISPGFSSIQRDSRIEIIRKPASHTELAGYYHKATAFIFPSLHETFGMPIMEAMSSGCPVITSNSTACAEIAADAGMLVDPRSDESLEIAMVKLASDASLRKELSSRGLARSEQFTWQRSAKMHIEAFHSALRAK